MAMLKMARKAISELMNRTIFSLGIEKLGKRKRNVSPVKYRRPIKLMIKITKPITPKSPEKPFSISVRWSDKKMVEYQGKDVLE